jgi:hypothetical protein
MKRDLAVVVVTLVLALILYRVYNLHRTRRLKRPTSLALRRPNHFATPLSASTA